MLLIIVIFLKLISCAAWSLDISSKEVFFNSREEFYTENMDFTGSFPELKTIDIDARRQKRVALKLVGDYPVLEKIQYEGTFGYLVGSLTGSFPALENVQYLCSACSINLDLTGIWEKSCRIVIKNCVEPIVLKLPKDIGVIITTKTAMKGKVKAIGLEKKRSHLRKKVFVNSLFLTSPVVLNIEVETVKGGNITLIG